MRDVAISPFLWRLDCYGVSLPKPAVPLMKYAEHRFNFARAMGESGALRYNFSQVPG